MAQRFDNEITSENLLICEGRDDVAFFKQLISVRSLPHFCIRDTSKARGEPGGNKKFGEKLKALKTDRGFKKVRRILIAADNDEAPTASFSSIQSQIRDVFGKAPAHPTMTETISHLQVTILMIPWTAIPGTLETLCKDAAHHVDPTMSAFVDKFLRDSGAEGRATPIHRDEMWLRCDLSARCYQDPFVGLAHVFSDRPSLIPLNDKSFNHIANLLDKFK